MAIQIINPRPVVIYGLIDPKNTQLRYVGKTVRKPAARLNSHIKDPSCSYRGRWIRSLINLGLKPDIIRIEVVDENTWQEAEIFWIAYFKSIGCNLTNRTVGGDGVSGWKHTEEVKKNISKRLKGKPGTPHTEETKRYLSAIRLGIKLSKEVSEALHIAAANARRGSTNSPEHRRKISLAKIGKPPPNKGKPSPLRGIPSGRTNPPELRKKMADGLRAAMIGKPKSLEQRLKMAETRRRWWAAKKTTS